MKSNKARFVKRRRNALLAACALAIVLIIIIVAIIVGITKNSTKKSTVDAVATPTPGSVLPTIAPTDEPGTDSPLATVEPTPTATSETGSQMYVTGDSVNVRKTASSSGEILTKLTKNTSVTAYGIEGDFYKIKTPSGEIGYMSKNYLSSAKSTATEAPSSTPDTSKSTTMYVKGSDVNVRDKASSSGSRLTRLSDGTKVTAYSTTDGWTYVQYASGKYGYISSSYLTAKTATTATAAASTPTPTPAHASDLVSIIGAADASKLGTVSEKYLNVTKPDQTAEKITDYHNYDRIYRIEKISGGAYYVGFDKDGGYKYGDTLNDFNS